MGGYSETRPTSRRAGLVLCGTLERMADIEWGVVIPPQFEAEWDAAPAERQAEAQAWAEQVLRALTGGVFGLIPDKVRPRDIGIAQGSTYDGTLGGGLVYGWPARQFYGPARCLVKDVALPGPIHSVTEVRVDGEVLTAAAYRIRNRRWLRRVDGKGWPECPDLDAADDAPGAFVVTYVRGIEVPEAGKIAAGTLAVEALRDMAGRECALPRGLTQITREGLTATVDPRAYFEEGLTGIDSVDQWILAIGRRPGSRIVNPQHRSPVRFS